MKETTITKNIVAHLRDRGWFVWKIHGGAFQRAGMPDLMALRDARVWFIEVKCPGKKPTKLQQKTLDELGRNGASTVVATSVDDLRMMELIG